MPPALLLLLLLCLTLASAAPRGHGKVRISDLSNSPQTVDLVEDILRHQLPVLEAFFGSALRDSATVVISAGERDFYRYRQARLPDWAAAAYLPAWRTILLRSPRWKGSIFSFEKSLRHELAHLYINQMFGSGAVPLWYNEGLAEILSGETVNLLEAGRIARDIRGDQVPTLAEIDSLTAWPRLRAEMGYIYSFTAANYLLQRLNGTDGRQHFHRSIVRDGWEEALRARAGLNSRELEVFWFRDLEKKYRWLLILNFENLLWLGIIFTFLLAFLLVRWRNRRKLRHWQAEEIE